MEYRTSLPRAALGLAAGPFVGAALLTLLIAFNFGGPIASVRWLGLPPGMAIGIFGVVLASCLAVVLILGGPAWYVLHRKGYRRWHDSAVLGAIGGPVVPVGYSAFHNTLGNISPSGLVAFVAIGAVVGVTAWRVAYRKRR